MPDLKKIFANFCSEPITNITPLSGGALHKMWHVETKFSEFAVKEINPYIAKKSQFPDNYETSEKIANFFHAQGIPAVCAISIEGHYVHQLKDAWVIIYPYMPGKILELNEITERHALQIGNIFSNIHNLRKQTLTGSSISYEAYEWAYLINQSKNETLHKLKSVIFSWDEKYCEAIAELNRELIISHCDMHLKNVLWNEKNDAFVIDWESAGPINPKMEIIGYGLEWSGILYAEINKSIFETIIASYVQNLKERSDTSIKSAFYGWLGQGILAWTEFNLRRQLGLVSQDKNEIALGKDIIENRMIKCLLFIYENQKEIIKYIKNIF